MTNSTQVVTMCWVDHYLVWILVLENVSYQSAVEMLTVVSMPIQDGMQLSVAILY